MEAPKLHTSGQDPQGLPHPVQGSSRTTRRSWQCDAACNLRAQGSDPQGLTPSATSRRFLEQQGRANFRTLAASAKSGGSRPGS